MTALDVAAQVRVRIDAVKAGAHAFGTNFYLQDRSVERAFKNHALFFHEFPGAVLLKRCEADFDRLYYAAAGPEALTEAIRQFVPVHGRPLVADVIGRPTDTGMWVEPFIAGRFERYSSFQRMQRVISSVADQAALRRARTVSRMLNPKLRDGQPQVIRIAVAAEAGEIAGALYSQFDRLAEHLPDVEEVLQAVAAGTILVIRDGGALAAVLYYDRSGLTTTCRYWLAMPGYRGLGYAELLMERYFQECTACRRSLLWVQEGNRAAIPLYRAYGFKDDSLVDVVLVRR